MRRLSSSPLRAAGLSAFLLPAGCASTVGPVDPLAYAATSCSDLDVSIGGTSKNISSVAITRGKIDRLNVPFWVPGGDKAVSVIRDRQSRKIEQLQGQLAAMRTEREARCP